MRLHSFPIPALLIALLAVGCGGGGAATPGPVTTPTAPPTAAPAPATPAPVLPPTASSLCVSMGYGNPKAPCGRGRTDLADGMSAAIDRVIATRPNLFDARYLSSIGDPLVLDQEGYYNGLIEELTAAGICADLKPNSMFVRVKSSNEWNEEYQPITSKGFPWRGAGSYSTTCAPAQFPLEPIENIDWVFVTAYAFYCDPDPPPTPPERGSRPVFPMACDARVTATPKTWDGYDVPESVHGQDVVWELETNNAVIKPWPDNPFNVTLYAQAPGPVKLCATVKHVRGCLSGEIRP